MKSNRFRDLACAMVGVGGLLAYILACAPAFSPDGSRVLFTSFSKKPDAVSIVLYNLRSHQLQTVFSQPGGVDKDMSGLMLGRWSSDGKRIIVIWQDEKRLSALALPVDGEGASQFYKLPEQGTDQDGPIAVCMYFPPPVVGEYLFLPGRQLCRLNLQTGSAVLGTSTNGFVLRGQGTNVFYMTRAGQETNMVEIGRLAPDSLTLTPIERIVTSSKNEGGFWDVAPDGVQVAIAVENPPTIQIHRGGALLKSIPVNVGTNAVELGPLTWAADSKALFACYQVGGAGGSGVLEISTQSDFQRVMPLCSKEGKEEIICAPALSPDGKTLAVSGFSDHNALFLIHLKERSWFSRCWSGVKPWEKLFFAGGREVTKVFLPKPPECSKPSSTHTNAVNAKAGAQGVRK